MYLKNWWNITLSCFNISSFCFNLQLNLCCYFIKELFNKTIFYNSKYASQHFLKYIKDKN